MKRDRFWKMLFAAAAVLLLAAELWRTAAQRPPRIVSPLWDMPPEMEEAVLAVESGWYSESLPLFAREIRVQEITDGYVRYKVLYFPFGSIERSYTRAADGTWYFNLEEPLTRFKIVRGLRQGGTV